MAGADKKTKKKNKKKSGKKTKNRKKVRLAHPFRLFVTIYIILMIVLVSVLYLIPWLSDNFADVMTVEYGQLNQSKDATVYFVKDETVYYANADGRVGYHFNEGDNVRRGQTLFDIDSSVSVVDDMDYSLYDQRVSSIYGGENLISIIEDEDRDNVLENLRGMLEGEENQINLVKINLAITEVESLAKGIGSNKGINVKPCDTGVMEGYIADTSGVVSYELDGYESELNPYTASLLDKEKLDAMAEDSINVFNGAATNGEPVCKVVNDREWYAVSFIDPGKLGRYQEGGKIKLIIDSKEMKGTVEKIYERDDQLIIVMKFVSYYDDIATLRKAKAKITTSDETGLIVKNSFITEKDGIPGVNVIDVAGDTSFVPINIKASDGDYSLVSSGTFTNEDGEMIPTVEVYDQIKRIS